MYISKIKIKNFRNFDNSGQIIKFVKGVNVLTGNNNSGKTNVIKALQLVFDRNNKKKLTIDDFNKGYSEFSIPPSIQIEVTLQGEKDETENDKVVVYDWIETLDHEYEAKLTFSYEFPGKIEAYNTALDKCKDNDGYYDKMKAWKTIDKFFLKKYTTNFFGGDPERKNKADAEMLDKFDFQFLDAIRDAERQMSYGHNTILKQVLTYFLDYEITQGNDINKLESPKQESLRHKEERFAKLSHCMFNFLKKRISQDKILEYSKETGANRAGEPNFDTNIGVEDLLFALRLVVNKEGIDVPIPISNNGLGYNNLLYIALVLSRIQIESQNSIYGENAKVFPILAIEEPEAHLHPSMQFKLLQFLNKNLSESGNDGNVRQIFVTTHSTHITSAVELDSLICLYGNGKVGYPGKAFGANTISKNYVKRFLDATKSNMLLADKIIFVEGLAEQILLPVFAAYQKDSKDKDITNEEKLINEHISTVTVDSRTFNHFLRIFAYKDEVETPFAVNKKVVCITDADPEIQKGDNHWHSCFPFELKVKADNKSKPLASHVKTLKEDFENKFTNIKIFHPEEGKGKTLEYELAKYNLTSELLITDCFPKQNSPHTKKKFSELQSIIKDNKGYTSLVNKYKEQNPKEKISEKMNDSDWSEEEKAKGYLSAIYYSIVKKLKGEHALYLAENLRKDLTKESPEFIVPKYIVDAINEILK
jgi:predicted ATP-dependent endonuclease of OLD family